MKVFSARQLQVWTVMIALLMLAGCGLNEGIHVSRDEGASTSRFRYEYEAISGATVMREDTEPRWRLGRYVFVPGADQLLVVSRITSWSDTATKKQRQSGDIPDMRDRMLERLWITIPQGVGVGDELDLHNLEYRFLVSYDQGYIDDAQFARSFRVFGNVRILEETETHLRVRLRVSLTTAETTAWEVNESNLLIEFAPQGRYAKRAKPDAVVYAVSRAGELPSLGPAPVKLNDQGQPEVTPGRDFVEPFPATQPESGDTPAATQPASEAQQLGIEETGQPGELAGRWYRRSADWEVFLQLDADNTFVQTACRPQATPAVLKGDWRLRSGYLVLQVKSFTVGGVNQMKSQGNNAYAILQVNWLNPHAVNLDGDLPGPGTQRGGYVLRRAQFPDLKMVPALSYQPDGDEPLYVGQAPADETKASGETAAPAGDAPAGDADQPAAQDNK